MDGWPSEETLVREALKVGEPAIDRARSVNFRHQHVVESRGARDSVSGRGVSHSGSLKHLQAQGRAKEVPARRACLSLRPCRISSSSFLVRSSSSLSRRSPSSRMRCKKSFTSSDPSGFVGGVMIPVARCRTGTANSGGKWWFLERAGGGIVGEEKWEIGGDDPRAEVFSALLK